MGSSAVATPTKPTRARAQRRIVNTGRHEYSRNQRLLIGLVSVVVVFGLWEAIAVGFDVDQLFLPSLSATLGALRESYDSGVLMPNLWISAQLYAVSMALSIAIGVPLGIIVGAVAPLRRVVTPWLWAIYTTPGLVFLPLILLWVGINSTARMLLILLSAIPPIAVIVLEGVKTVENSLVRVGIVFGGSRQTLLRKIVLPSTMPYIGTGIRLGVSKGLVGLFGAELFTAQTGLGFIIMQAGRRFDTPLVFGILLVYLILCSVLISLSGVLERKLGTWRD